MPPRSFASGSFLDSLPGPDARVLLELGHEREWQRGEALIRSGERADSAIVMLDGLVKIHKTAADGQEVVFGIAGPGDLLGEVSASRESVRSASVTALVAVTGRVVLLPELRSFLGSHPRATLALLDLTLHRLYVADSQRVELATSESLARVSSRIVELAERFGQPTRAGAIEAALPINQEELASWSGSSRESTARALRTLRELGLIQTHRLRLTVLDLERLRANAPHV
jgi:CRP/FNR family cyclic AMP-dependent transcriptional regulator